MAKVLQTLRNNWKKTIFFTVAGAYGVNWLNGKYEDSLTRQEYCERARVYGEVPLRGDNKLRKVTVFLNPAARQGKGKELFQKNVAPILHVAGLQVNLVLTEYEGQAKEYMGVIEDTDAIVVAGGDGTLMEVITGLLRRDDAEALAKIPIGVIPLGQTNTLAGKLFQKGKSEVKWFADCAMAVIEGIYKPIDVMCIKGKEDKTVYAVSGLNWGAFREAQEKRSKYWYMGPLKHRWIYIKRAMKQAPLTLQAGLTYTPSCEGCSKCYTPPPPPVWRWWHVFYPPKEEKPAKDYSKIENPECGAVYNQEVAAVEVKAEANQVPQAETNAIKLTLGAGEIGATDFIKEGWNREKGQPTGTDKETHQVQAFSLQPHVPEGQEAWFTIDSEEYEAMPIEVKLLKDKLRMFCASREETTPQ